MEPEYMTAAISDTILPVGVYNPDEIRFENQYSLPEGMSYNSYAILGGGGDVAVLDSVDICCGEHWMRRIEEATGGVAPRWIVAHHAEPDHSANIAKALERWPECKLVATAKCLEMTANFHPAFDFAGRTLAVKDGDTLEIGSHRLRFITAPMVHWPEVMVSYDETDRVLFSADAFGSFGQNAVETPDWAGEARRYYCNIVGKYGAMVRTLLSKVSGLSIDCIAPLHGPVLKSTIGRALDLYGLWSSYTPESKGVLVAYASIYGGTARCAELFTQMLRERGVREVYTADLTAGEPSEAVSQAFRFGTMVLAASTYDAGVFPPMQGFINRLVSKGLRGRRVGLIQNGSWAPVAASVMRKRLEDLQGMEFIDPVVTIRSTVHETDMESLGILADAVAETEK